MLAIGQTAVMYTVIHELTYWLGIAPAIIACIVSTTCRSLCDSQFSVQRADQVFPDQVVKDERNGGGERENVSSESWNRKIQQAGCDHSQWRQ